jgi:hypothetical protein
MTQTVALKQAAFPIGDFVVSNTSNNLRRAHDSSAMASVHAIRRECLDHVVALAERQVRHLLANYQAYYDGLRTHLALDNDSLRRSSQTVGKIASIPWLGSLHRQYTQMA